MLNTLYNESIRRPGSTKFVAEDTFESVDPLAKVSKQSGFVLFESVIELIPDLEELPGEPALLEERPDRRADANDERGDDADEFFETDTFDKTHDPVRLYLREMGAVRLLNRDGEVGI